MEVVEQVSESAKLQIQVLPSLLTRRLKEKRWAKRKQALVVGPFSKCTQGGKHVCSVSALSVSTLLLPLRNQKVCIGASGFQRPQAKVSIQSASFSSTQPSHPHLKMSCCVPRVAWSSNSCGLKLLPPASDSKVLGWQAEPPCMAQIWLNQDSELLT